ncbi:hypothetical protein FQR65_LT06323 [Abscondita terminalis]|nr:hypothetical protein FQR65_LT06323 [Abscondita terminalis]
MVLSTNSDAFELQKIVFLYTGFWPKQNPSKLYKLYGLINYMPLVMLSSMLLLNVVLLEDFGEVMQSLSMLISALNTLIKLTTFYLKKSTFLELLDLLESSHFSYYEEKFDNYLKKAITIAKYMSKTFLFSGMTLVFIVFGPLQSDKTFPMPFPFNIHKQSFIVYFIVYVLQFVAASASALNTVTFDNLSATMMGLSSAYFKILQKTVLETTKKYKSFSNHQDPLKFYKTLDELICGKLNECVNHHIALISGITILFVVFGPVKSDKGFPLPVPFNLPKQSFIVYFIVYVLQFVSALSSALNTTTVDNLSVTMMGLSSAYFKILQKTVLETTKKYTNFRYQGDALKFHKTLDDLICKKLNECVNHHMALIRCVATVLSLISAPLLQDPKERITPTPFPINLKDQPIIFYYVVYTFQSLALFSAAFNTTGFDNLSTSMIGLCSAYYSILQKSIIETTVNYENVTNHDSVLDMYQTLDETVYKKIRECVAHHVAVIGLTERIENMFSYVFLCQLLSSVGGICLAGFTFINTDPGSMEFIFALSFMATLMFQISLYCFYGNEVTIQSAMVRDACYMTEWIYCGPMVRKHLFLIMERSKRPMVLTAGKFVNLSLASLVTVSIGDSTFVVQILFKFISLGAFSCSTLFTWPSPTIPILLSNSSYIKQVTIDDTSYFAVIPPFCAILSAPLITMLMDTIGKRKVIMFAAIPHILSWLLIIFARSLRVLYISRIFYGISDSVLWCIPAYIGEISTPKVRGSWGNFMAVLLYFGLFMTNVVGSFNSIRTTALIFITVPIASILLLTASCESPYYLITKGKTEEAENSLKYLRWNNNVKQEFNVLVANITHQTSGTIKDLWCILSNRNALLIVLTMRFSFHFSGFSVFAVYSQYIFSIASGSLSASFSAIIYSFVLFILCVVFSFTVDTFGRRPSMIFSIIGCTIALFIEAFYFYLVNNTEVNLNNYNWVPLTGLLFYIASCAPGLGIVPNLMLGELFPPNVKNKAVGIYGVCNSLGILIVPKLFQVLCAIYGLHVPFFVCGCCTLMSIIISYLYVPETRLKTLEEIQKMLMSKS